jgi:hypothetical protein
MQALIMSAYCHMETLEFERFSLGQASAEETEQFEEHLLICVGCQKRYEDIESYVRALRSGTAEMVWGRAPRRSWWSWPRVIPALAFLCLLVGVLALAGMRSAMPQPFAVSLTAMRGGAPGTAAPARRPLVVRPDLTGIGSPGPYRLEIVDEQARVTWQGRFEAARAAVPVGAQRPGAHFVRIYSPSENLLREYGLYVGK